MATVSMAYRISPASGSALTGAVVSLAGYRAMLAMTAVVATAGLLLTVLRRARLFFAHSTAIGDVALQLSKHSARHYGNRSWI